MEVIKRFGTLTADIDGAVEVAVASGRVGAEELKPLEVDIGSGVSAGVGKGASDDEDWEVDEAGWGCCTTTCIACCAVNEEGEFAGPCVPRTGALSCVMRTT
jgi:hypothetical protein